MPKSFPRIRDDLVIQEIKKSDGTRAYVIKDPVTNAYFQVGEAEYFIISSFDGATATAEIARKFKEKFESDIDEESINGFAGELQKLCFLDNDLTRQELLKKQHEEAPAEKRSIFKKLTFFKVKAFNPTRVFNFLLPRIGIFFTRTFVWIATLLIIFSALIFAYNVDGIYRAFWGLLNLKGIILIYLSMFVVNLLHEFAHGLTCRHFGGQVREIGFLFIYFQPAFYCNVSDAWLFPEKRQKLWVSFSGAFFQLFIWAIAVIVWRVTALDTLVNKTALAVLTFSGIATLFNFNPLLRYDGYYLLSDYLEIPNLRIKATNYWNNLVKQKLLGIKGLLDSLTGRERKIYFYYGILSFLYIVFVLGYFFVKLGELLVSELGGTGFLIFAAILVFLFRNFIVDTSKGILAFLKRRRVAIITAVVIVVLAVMSALVSLELRVKGELVINPMESLLLKYSSTGYAELIQYSADNSNPGKSREVSTFTGDYSTTSLLPLVRHDEQVTRGQVIARLANSETQRLIDEYTAELEQAQEELALLERGARPEEIEKARNNVDELKAQLKSSSQNLARMSEMLERELIAKQDWEEAQTDSVIWDSRLKAAQNELDKLRSGARPEEIRAKQAEVDRLAGQIEFHTRQQEQFDIKSTIDGTVMSVDTGEVALEISGLDTMNALITLSERELADIRVDQKVKFKVRGYPELSFYGRIYRIDRKVIVDEYDKRVFQVACRVPNGDHTLRPGMTGVANVYCGKRTIADLIYRKFFRTIRTEFWDWFDWI